MKIGYCGSVESNDCMITVTESDKLEIEINSIVDDFFHDEIEKVIKDTLKDLNIDKIYVKCDDKGALNYTIKARLETAIARLGETNA